ncbi:MAG: hypothetical protein AAB590_03985 [Patescibacteria group bacterium]
MLDTTNFKKLLEEERKRLTRQLSGIAEIDPNNPSDWVPTPPPDIQHEADPIDAADEIEEYAERIGIEVPLEEQLRKVNAALVAIESGTYGTCNIGGSNHPIEPERLEANPSALTCVAHMNS